MALENQLNNQLSIVGIKFSLNGNGVSSAISSPDLINDRQKLESFVDGVTKQTHRRFANGSLTADELQGICSSFEKLQVQLIDAGSCTKPERRLIEVLNASTHQLQYALDSHINILTENSVNSSHTTNNDSQTHNKPYETPSATIQLLIKGVKVSLSPSGIETALTSSELINDQLKLGAFVKRLTQQAKSLYKSGIISDDQLLAISSSFDLLSAQRQRAGLKSTTERRLVHLLKDSSGQVKNTINASVIKEDQKAHVLTAQQRQNAAAFLANFDHVIQRLPAAFREQFCDQVRTTIGPWSVAQHVNGLRYDANYNELTIKHSGGRSFYHEHCTGNDFFLRHENILRSVPDPLLKQFRQTIQTEKGPWNLNIRQEVAVAADSIIITNIGGDWSIESYWEPEELAS